MQNNMKLQDALERARQDRDILTAKLNNVKSSLQRVDAFIQYAEKYLSDPQQQILFDTSAESKKAMSQRFSRLSMAKAAEIILLENNVPMHVDEILQELVKGGYHDPKYMSLYPTLSRRKQFYKEEKPGYFGLAEWKK